MPPEPRPETVLVLQMLSDGDWHALDELVAKCAHVITPGRAMRHREQRVAAMARRPGGKRGEGPKRERSPAYMIAVGRRDLVRIAIPRRAEKRTNPSGAVEYRLPITEKEVTP